MVNQPITDSISPTHETDVVRLKSTKGNLLSMFSSGKLHVIGHGCNCFHSMSGGIAYQIAKSFPPAVIADNETPYGNPSKLGSLSYIQYGKIQVKLKRGTKRTHPSTIYNLYTQYNGGSDFRLREFSSSLFKMIDHVCSQSIEYSVKTDPTFDGREKELEGLEINVGIPTIGSGIGGGDWIEIYKTIVQVVMECNLSSKSSHNIQTFQNLGGKINLIVVHYIP